MKHIPLLVVLVLFKLNSFSQPIASESIEDSVIGWMKIWNFKGAKEPLKIDDKVYSIAQLSIADSIANWMQASYMPKGSLGEVKKMVSEKVTPYNQYTAGRPQSYGAYVKTYTELGYNNNRKVVPLSNSHLLWRVVANGMYGYPVEILCTPSQYYFLLPNFEEQGYNSELEKVYDLSGHPYLNKFPAYYVRNSVTGNEKMAILTKDYQLPFVKVTKGEYLRAVEAAVMREYEREKKEIHENKGNNQQNIEYFMKYLNEKQAKRLACLKNNKEKYQGRLNEEATLFNIQPDVMLENYSDVFEGTGNSGIKIPVYKVDPAIAARCKSDNPQWIVVAWTAAIDNPVGKQLQEAILNNFNFEYVYNFFFAPEKVKRQPYKPLRSPVYKEAVVLNAASSTSKKNNADNSIYFFDDFSSTPAGRTLVGWKSSLGYFTGKASQATVLDELEGNWATINDHVISPRQLKVPLPQEFSLSFDLVVKQNFTWGAKGMSVDFSKISAAGETESHLQVRLRPGFGGREGEISIDTKFAGLSTYENNYKSYKAPGFSNNKKNNRIAVAIKLAKEKLQVYVDGNLSAEYDKGFQKLPVFNKLAFSSGNNNDQDAYYLTNVKITRN